MSNQPSGADQPRAAFITIEGIDGAGKTTQARAVAAWLRDHGHEVALTREPGGTPLGESLRQLLLGGAVEVDAVAELLLYAADRAQHVAQVIRPALHRGQTVVCERFTDSTIAYQGYGRRLDPTLVQTLNDTAAAGLAPELTILLELTPENARPRLAETPDRLEREALDFHRRVADGFRALARAHGDRIKVVDASAPAAEVARRVVAVVKEFWRKRAPA